MATLKAHWIVLLVVLLAHRISIAISLNTTTAPTVCFGARDDSYGSLYVDTAVSVSSVLLTYVSGEVYNAGSPQGANWGNGDWFGVFMTDSNNAIVFPDASNNGNTLTTTLFSNGWYKMSGYSPRTDPELH